MRSAIFASLAAFYAVEGYAASPIQGAPDRVPQLEVPAELDPAKRQPTKIGPIDLPKPAKTGGAQTMAPSKFEVIGLQNISQGEVQPLLEGMVGKPVTLAQIVDGINKVTAHLQARGYLLSYAYLPAQDFKGRVVKVGIVEGYLDSVNIQGNAGKAEPKIRQIAQKLLNEKPLTRKTFEYYSQVFAQLNGIQAAISAQPAPNFAPGTPLNVLVGRKTVDGTFGIVPGVNGVDPIFTVTTNSLTEQAESITISVIPKDNNQYIGLNYSQPLGTEGDRLSAQASYNHNRQDINLFNLSNLHYETENVRLGAFYHHPFLLEANQQVSGTIGFYGDKRHDVYTNKLNGMAARVETETRVLATEITKAMKWRNYQLQGALGVFKGFDALGAGQENGIVDLDFVRLRGQVGINYVQRVGFGWAASLVGQYSDDILPPSEKLIVGNRYFAQGYPVGEASGDKGAGATLEANYGFEPDIDLIKQVQPYLLTDIASVSLNSDGAQSRSIASLALGVRISNRKNYSLDLNIAKPVGDMPIDQNHRTPRLNFSYYLAF